MRRLVIAALVALSAIAQEIPAGWFPFQTDARVAPESSLGSVAFLNPGPASQRISLKDGHFALPDGSRIRFFGTNVTFSRAFPDKEVAPLIAKRMRQLGINVVRFHHMDNRHIWNADQTAFEPDMVDRLQWFIHCLNQEGIYVNINLHVSRWYKGLSHKSAFHYGKGLDRFYPPFIEQQKQYARELLTAVSPYSKLPMTDDPGVFCIEINNEDAIDLLENSYNLAELSGTPWGDCLLVLWHGWLARKYGNAPAVIQAWTAEQQPLSSVNMVAGMTPHFEGEQVGYFEPSQPAEGEYELKLLKDGTVDWAYQMHFFSITLKEGGRYLARFRIRCDVPRVIHVSLAHAEPPWHNYCSKAINVTPEWQEVEVQLNVMGLQNVKKRFTLNLQGRSTPATVVVKDIGLFEGERPMPFANAAEFSQIPFPEELAPMTMSGDYRTFLRELDFRYSREMTDFLKGTLKVKALVTDTQASYGGVFGHLRESEIADFVDMHAYWQHPLFAAGHSWSALHWTIGNSPMVDNDSGGVLTYLSRWRTAGKPFTVSEYDHPAPSEHLAEMFPLLGSFAAFQDWDGLYQFSYVHPVDMKEKVRLAGYFSMAPNPAKMVTSHFAAMVFRLGLIPPAEQAVTITVPQPLIRNLLMDNELKKWSTAVPGYPSSPFFAGRLETRFVEEGDAVTVVNGELGTALPLRTSCLTWSLDKPQQGIFIVNAPKAKAAMGHLGGRTVPMGEVTVAAKLPKTDTAAFTLVALDDREIAASQRMLLSLVGTIANVGMEWDENHTTIKDRWGDGPAIAKFIPAEIILPGEARPTVTALDPAGNPMGTIPVDGGPHAWRFATLPEMPSLWFYVSR